MEGSGSGGSHTGTADKKGKKESDVCWEGCIRERCRMSTFRGCCSQYWFMYSGRLPSLQHVAMHHSTELPEGPRRVWQRQWSSRWTISQVKLERHEIPFTMRGEKCQVGFLLENIRCVKTYSRWAVLGLNIHACFVKCPLLPCYPPQLTATLPHQLKHEGKLVWSLLCKKGRLSVSPFLQTFANASRKNWAGMLTKAP